MNSASSSPKPRASRRASRRLPASHAGTAQAPPELPELHAPRNPLTLHRTPGRSILHLASDIDISLAAELHQLLLEALADPSPLHIDLQQASALNVTAVQMLRAAQRHAAVLGRTFVIEAPLPASIAATLEFAGLDLQLETA